MLFVIEIPRGQLQGSRSSYTSSSPDRFQSKVMPPRQIHQSSAAKDPQ